MTPFNFGQAAANEFPFEVMQRLEQERRRRLNGPAVAEKPLPRTFGPQPSLGLREPGMENVPNLVKALGMASAPSAFVGNYFQPPSNSPLPPPGQTGEQAYGLMATDRYKSALQNALEQNKYGNEVLPPATRGVLAAADADQRLHQKNMATYESMGRPSHGLSSASALTERSLADVARRNSTDSQYSLGSGSFADRMKFWQQNPVKKSILQQALDNEAPFGSTQDKMFRAAAQSKLDVSFDPKTGRVVVKGKAKGGQSPGGSGAAVAEKSSARTALDKAQRMAAQRVNKKAKRLGLPTNTANAGMSIDAIKAAEAELDKLKMDRTAARLGLPLESIPLDGQNPMDAPNASQAALMSMRGFIDNYRRSNGGRYPSPAEKNAHVVSVMKGWEANSAFKQQQQLEDARLKAEAGRLGQQIASSEKISGNTIAAQKEEGKMDRESRATESQSNRDAENQRAWWVQQGYSQQRRGEYSERNKPAYVAKGYSQADAAIMAGVEYDNLFPEQFKGKHGVFNVNEAPQSDSAPQTTLKDLPKPTNVPTAQDAQTTLNTANPGLYEEVFGKEGNADPEEAMSRIYDLVGTEKVDWDQLDLLIQQAWTKLPVTTRPKDWKELRTDLWWKKQQENANVKDVKSRNPAGGVPFGFIPMGF